MLYPERGEGMLAVASRICQDLQAISGVIQEVVEEIDCGGRVVLDLLIGGGVADWLRRWQAGAGAVLVGHRGVGNHDSLTEERGGNGVVNTSSPCLPFSRVGPLLDPIIRDFDVALTMARPDGELFNYFIQITYLG